MNCDKKISIIIPAYNIAPYLPRCLDSVLEQTYTNLEIIVVDDGSKDDTRAVIEEYAERDNRIVPVYKENTGVSDTRNKGLDVATGDYIGFIDGDDYIEKNMYEVLMSNAIKYNADISHCGYKLKFPENEYYLYNTGKLIEQDKQQGVIDLLEGTIVEPSLCNKLFKRHTVENVRMKRELKNNEDYLFNIMAFANSEKSVFEDKALYNYIMRVNSATTSAGLTYNKVFDAIKVRNIITEMFENDSRVYPVALHSQLKIAIQTYRNVTTNKQAKEFKGEQGNIKKQVTELYKKIKPLGVISKRTRMDSILIIYFPVLFKLLYILYSKTIKNRSKIYSNSV
ncbi:MAG: glycosyltransferase family 2 protein [Clostridia bacterium]|nr:glycosyltransferase family 2 protein [Clostridia bacterium]MEE1125884.1 glycosyltransferase family 2 protein [Acutalibacteraceae bacterium]